LVSSTFAYETVWSGHCVGVRVQIGVTPIELVVVGVSTEKTRSPYLHERHLVAGAGSEADGYVGERRTDLVFASLGQRHR
jgi:hypothetical protein